MDTQTVVLLLGFWLVAVIAVVALRQKHRLMRLLKQQLQKEPVLDWQISSAAVAGQSVSGAEYPAAPMPDVAMLANQNRPVTEEPVIMAEQRGSPPTSEPMIVESVAPAPTFNVTPRDFIVLTLLAEAEHPYAGYELLQALLVAGLRFGRMGVFHRYENAVGEGPILFSLASAVEPGIFELNKMGSFSCPGLTMFLRLSDFQEGHKENKEVLQAFELMIETARQLVDDLGGEVCDEQRHPLAEEKISDWRLYLAHYERTRQIPEFA